MPKNKKRGRGRGQGSQNDQNRQPTGSPAIIKRSEKNRGRGRGRGGAQAFTPTHPSSRLVGKKKQKGGASKSPFTQIAEEVPEDSIIKHQDIPRAHNDAVMAINITPTHIFTASRDKMLKKWKVEPNPQNGRFMLVQELSVELGDQCWCMLSIHDWLFCGLGSGRIRGFKPGKELTVEGHAKRCSVLMMHENVLLSGGSDASVKLWMMDPASETLSCTNTISEAMPGPISDMRALGAHLWVGGAGGIAIVELATLRVVHQLPPKKFVAGLLPFEGHMIVMYADGAAGIFDASGGSKLSNPPLPAGPVLSIVGLHVPPSPTTPGFARVLCGHAKGQVSSLALPMFEVKKYWQALERCKVQCMGTEGQNGIFIIGAENGSLQLWQKNPASA